MVGPISDRRTGLAYGRSGAAMSDHHIAVIVDGTPVEMISDPTGHHGVVELDGLRHIVYATIVRCGPQAVSPPKARLRRYVGGIEQPLEAHS
ncbi:hypothetical protein [Mycolicibacterium celeriflavum]|uniref:Uncharacterized protein n=1 Tax=Mycolicibacterium celeriflavum TaxID=1249101 RepID=A0A1X0BKH8_MYCCF|nr:hypothetical protein [Mycolicibacterium celeriflavum]MCV7236552.1 hypothetical protein [Mycolicibacterium celeriflavum]ORA43051.1 hypothetical protein BST21_22500 [Mycolicibacterium celeriflavum]BBY41805.1 hypothetical protein MCEL_01000 [Mycolicibacterium celeriflavum]